MRTVQTTVNGLRRHLCRVSGEELLLLAVFGDSAMRRELDQELDRRAFLTKANGANTQIVPSPHAA